MKHNLRLISLDLFHLLSGQMNNVNSTTGTVTDGVSGSVRRLVLDSKADASSSGWRTLKPQCHSQSGMVITDRVRICWNLNSVNVWFGIIEIELYGNSEVSLGEDFREMDLRWTRKSVSDTTQFTDRIGEGLNLILVTGMTVFN